MSTDKCVELQTDAWTIYLFFSAIFELHIENNLALVTTFRSMCRVKRVLINLLRSRRQHVQFDREQRRHRVHEGRRTETAQPHRAAEEWPRRRTTDRRGAREYPPWPVRLRGCRSRSGDAATRPRERGARAGTNGAQGEMYGRLCTVEHLIFQVSR